MTQQERNQLPADEGSYQPNRTGHCFAVRGGNGEASKLPAPLFNFLEVRKL